MQDYKIKKVRSQIILKFIKKHLSKLSYERVCNCGIWLEMLADREEKKMKVYRANFCGNRFCSMCAWRLAHKDAIKIVTLMEYLKTEYDKDFISVVLTAPNVKANNLKNEITRFNKAFKNFYQRNEIVKMHDGYVRKLEITYNAQSNTYHPHFHCIFVVNKSYFSSRDYVKHGRWLELWREVMSDSTISQVNVKRFDSNVNEIAKYAAKDSDYATSQEIFNVFYKALKGRQVLTFNGLFAEANKLYKAGKLDDYKIKDDTNYIWLILYYWCGTDYVEQRRWEIAGQGKKDESILGSESATD